MAEILTIAGTDRTALLFGDTLKIEQAAAEFAAVCSFQLTDRTGTTLSVKKGDEVVVTDDSTSPATTLFSGEVTNVRDAMLDVGHPGRRIQVECQDWNVLIEEILVYAPATFTDDADAAVIGNMFTTYCPAVDASTHISLLSNITITFEPCTLRRALERICELTGGRWYIDAEKKLHYFDAESNVAAWYLSDSPDLATSFPYQSITRNENATPLYNYVLVQGKELSEWYHDAASAALYGERAALLTDQRIEDVGTLNKRGAAFLARWAWPRVSYDVVTRKSGLQAGMDVRLVCGTWGVDDTLTVRRLTIYWQGGQRFYRLELGDGVAPALTGGRVVMDAITGLQGQVLEIDDTVFDTTPPATPTFVAGNLTTGVDVDADGHQVVWVQATWGSVADDDLSYYQVQLSTASDFAGYTITRSHPADGDRLERFLPVLGNTLYYARVRAVDWVGNASAWSATRSITTARDTSAPAQVTGLSVAASRTLMGLHWTANSEADLATYEVQRAPDSGGAPGAYATIAVTGRLNFYVDQDFSDAQIAAQSTFWYRVRAIDSSENAGDWSTADSAALSQIASDHLAAGIITAVHVGANEIITNAANIKNATITSAKIVNLDGITITGNTIRTAASGARIVLDSTDGIQAYNAAGAQTVSILPSGAGWIGVGDQIAWNTAGGLTVDGGVLVSGTVVATAFSNAIGQPLFSAADGLALWGPGCEISPTAWVSTRGQTATITGAFHQEAGAWTGTRGLVIERGTTNHVLNPIFENNVTDGWTLSGTGASRTRDTAVKAVGSASCRLTCAVGQTSQIYQNVTTAVPNGQTVAAQVLLRRTGNYTADVLLYDTTNLATRASQSVTKIGDWERITLAWTNNTGSNANIRLWIRNRSRVVTEELWVDGCQVEIDMPTATSLCYGDRGSGYAWDTPTSPHNSTSTRTVTVVSLPDVASLLSSRSTYSIRTVVQMPYAANVTWPWGTLNALWAGDLTDVALYYNDDTDTFKLYIEGAARISSPVQTFAAGDVLDIVVTLDYASNLYYMYINGVLAGSYTGARSSPALTNFYLGCSSTNYAAGIVVDEFAVFGSVFTPDEVAALHLQRRPLIDAGATDLPGVYLEDGRFRLYSSQTGARTEIDVSGIRAYSAAAQSVHIKTTGDVLFGSNITAPATTALAVFATSQTYNSESLGAGDVLFGDNSASKANILWDASDGLLRFRGGTTTQVYIATDGSLRAGGGAIKIDVSGIRAYSAAAQSVHIKTTGDVLFGSNVASAAGTALAVFATAQTYNSESLGAGDVLFGDNSAAKANMLWDASEGKLLFRGGTTTHTYINTDGSFSAAGGIIKLNAGGMTIDTTTAYATTRAIRFLTSTKTMASLRAYRNAGDVRVLNLTLVGDGGSAGEDSNILIDSWALAGNNNAQVELKAYDGQGGLPYLGVYAYYNSTFSIELGHAGNAYLKVNQAAVTLAKPLSLNQLANDPSGMPDGTMYYNTSLKCLSVKINGTWRAVAVA